MEEFQEADILWPESIMQNPQSETFFHWPIYHHFTPSESESEAGRSNSTCTQDELQLQESELSWPGTGDDSFFLSIGNSSKEMRWEEEWQEADVLWPEQESLKHRGSDGDEDQLIIKLGEATKVSSPIDIPNSKQ
ncbi:hypothetical protein FCM35_KLT21700 [Carex littledalei]|uniref:Uncharacterized protein n=1 Tax=Carex littledalei TaxID=544730 RepID=A0A833VDP1_9POAL|nr:hypothetical protein FCM35_KLT21700 [Carex littledalei]